GSPTGPSGTDGPLIRTTDRPRDPSSGSRGSSSGSYAPPSMDARSL
ncbi:hypothetical protein MYU51_020373, partial [Penicillium brevicompactum]